MEAARVVEGGRPLSAVASQLWDYRTSRTYTDLVLQSAAVGLQTKVGEDFTITEKASTRAISWLKVSTSTLTFRNLCLKL